MSRKAIYATSAENVSAIRSPTSATSAVEVELRRQRLADAIHGLELADALTHLLAQTGAREGGSDVLADEGKEVLVPLGEALALLVALQHQYSKRAAFGA